MKLYPSYVDKYPRQATANFALVASALIRFAHPHERGWEYGANFLLGFGIAMFVADIVLRWNARSQK
jgi:hypothetical protein